jgi:hypothetical protein
VILFDIGSTVLFAFFGELIDESAISIFYVVIEIPLVYFFVRYGSLICACLTENKAKFSESMVRRQLQFVRRVRLSGLAVVLNLTNLILFSVLGNLSFPVWYSLLSCLILTYGWVSSLQIAAIQVPANSSHRTS